VTETCGIGNLLRVVPSELSVTSELSELSVTSTVLAVVVLLKNGLRVRVICSTLGSVTLGLVGNGNLLRVLSVLSVFSELSELSVVTLGLEGNGNLLRVLLGILSVVSGDESTTLIVVLIKVSVVFFNIILRFKTFWSFNL